MAGFKLPKRPKGPLTGRAGTGGWGRAHNFDQLKRPYRKYKKQR